MKKQYILFDFDGVIVNTEPQNAHYLQETLKSFGVYMDHEELKGFIGVNSREKNIALFEPVERKCFMGNVPEKKKRDGKYL